jgi:hypothetical protein
VQQRGQVEVRGRSGDVHTFRLGTGAICHLEETLNLDVMDLLAKLRVGKVRMSEVRDYVKASTTAKPDFSMTNDEAIAIVDDCGLYPLLDAMTDSLMETFNLPKADGAEEGTTNPPAAERRRRTKAAGTKSSSAPARKEL